jgi:Tol biopolymer transport system component
VAYSSLASNIISGDTITGCLEFDLATPRGCFDVFLHDRMGGGDVLVSASITESVGNSDSGSAFLGGSRPFISDDGRYVAFESDASNLVATDLNNRRDVFLRDTISNTTVLVSQATSGEQFDEPCSLLGMSADGRYVLLYSDEDSGVPVDDNNAGDLFIRDTTLGTTSLVCTTSSGVLGDAGCHTGAISGDGQYVAFVSYSTNLTEASVGNSDFAALYLANRATGSLEHVAFGSYGPMWVSIADDADTLVGDTGSPEAFVVGDDNDAEDVYSVRVASAAVSAVSKGAGGSVANGDSWWGAVSASGAYVVFGSNATDIVGGDTNDEMDIFRRDLIAEDTIRVTQGVTSTEPNGSSFGPATSSNGCVVVFESLASNLILDDENGVGDIFVFDCASGQIQRIP